MTRTTGAGGIGLIAGALLIASVGAVSAKELKSVGVAVSTMGNPFFGALVKGVNDEAHRINPNVSVTTVSADYELNKQFTQIDNFIAAGVDVILLVASDPNVIAPAVKRAQAAGIIVVAVDVSAKGADATVQTDNSAAGQMACSYLADKIGRKGNVIILNGPQVSSIVERVAGCKKTLAQFPDIKLLSSDQDGRASREGGLNAMQGLLTRFPDIQGLFVITDAETLGADLAAKQLNRSGIVMVSIDGAPDVIPAIKGGSQIVATVAQDPYLIGKTGVQIGNELLNGKKPETTRVLIEPKLVDRDNVADYKGW